MGVTVLYPRDCLNDIFSTNNLTSPHRRKKHRRSPPRQQSASSKKKNHNHTNNIVSSQVRILKRDEDIINKIPDLAIEKLDLKPSRKIGSDPMNIPTRIRVSEEKSTPASFYAGPVTSTSPPPSEVPLPAFYAKKNVSVFKSADASHATNDLIRILRLNIT